MMRHLLLACMAAAAGFAGSPGSDAVPLFFIANHGQAPATYSFIAQGSGLTAYFSPAEVLLRVADRTVRLEFPGASVSAPIEGVGELQARANFFTGSEGQWRTSVPLYRAVAYRELYPGIDMIYGGNGRNLKSEFVVAPGADSARIRLHYTGADAVRLDDDGALVVTIDGQDLREDAPSIFQERGGNRVTVDGQFSLASDGTVGFIVNDYDASLPLIIDPTISYSTLLGGSGSDAATALAVDATGAAYIAGFTASVNLPTANPEQNFNAGGNDIFVARLNAAGNGLVYCTYIGGKADDRAYGIAIDAAGAAYITGSTTSSNFPLRNALQSRLGGAKNAFVLKLNAAGNTLVFSTYLGGSGSDVANGIAVDSSGSAYVVGDTTSLNFPATAMQKGNRGSQDAFMVKLTADGLHIVYSTYLGGTGDEHGAAIALDASGDAYVTGSTWSGDFPVANAMQSRLGGGQDAFVVKLSADGNSLLFGTFLGGTGGALGYPEAGQGIAVDSQGNAYVAGVTSSGDFPLAHALQASRLGWTDAFVTKLSSAGALVYSTYVGGNGMDTANAIAVDAGGYAYIAGQTLSSDLPVVNATQATRAGDYDAFWGRLSPTGDSVLALSYLGGNGSDTATAAALDGTGSLYVAGWTLSTNFPIVNGYQSTNAGNYGAFVTKIAVTAALAAVGVTPNTGTGTSQTFSLQFSDTAGATDLTTVSMLVNAGVSTVNACSVNYNRAANTLMLLTDSGAAPGTSIAPGSGSQQNSQCMLNGAGSSVSISGNVLTLNLAITFQGAYGGSKTVYLQAANASTSTGWQQKGTWTIPASGPPVAVSVSPSSGSGTSQVFTFTMSDPKGYSAIISAQLLINTPMTVASGCYLYYYRNAIYLSNDGGTAWQNTPVTPGQSGTVQNSQCSVDGATSSATGSGNTITLNVALTFKPTFAGSRAVYMDVYDGAADSGWQQLGSWTVTGTGPPQAVSVTPASGTGTRQTFSFVFMDPKGYAAIRSALMLINGTLSVSSGCYLYYARASNTIYLTNDAGTAWQATPVTLGQSGTLSNSQCSVDPLNSSASGSGTNVTLNLTLNFTSSFPGPKTIYADVYDGTDESGWQQKGTWTVPGSGPPTVVSVSPASGAGSTQTFSFTFSDPGGYGAIVSAQMLFNTPISVSGGCYLLYHRATNAVYLTNDAGTAWQPTAITPGQGTTVQNSQCIVNGMSAIGTGNTLIVSVALTFKPAFSGSKGIYAEVYDGAGDSSWQQKGTWTVQ
jgi:hypothetical protein